jgi:hypothetical protein
MDARLFTDLVYPLQDAILAALAEVDTGFYLSGGTAASRAYLNHRFSEDLDLFVNDRPEFSLWASRCVARLASLGGATAEVVVNDPRFVRLLVSRPEVSVKVELINDVPARVGEVGHHPVLGRVDSAENILANKITALLDRREPKDAADIWAFVVRMGLSIEASITGAQSKAAGVFPPDVARCLVSVSRADWELVRWVSAPDVTTYLADLRRISESLLGL